jgi:serine/threonine protein kinase
MGFGFSVGDTVGPYKISAYIGQGGMATIYRAHQLTLDRDVALKVIHPALKEDQSFLMRLNREAAIVARLNHPNIVTVYDFGEYDGIPYLVMRYIEGKTLKAVLQEGKLSIDRILEIACAIGDALTYAHQHGVLHRDVKPSNVLIDGEGNVYLTDFGLARLAHSGESTLSQDMLIGSPQYVSPEQARAEPVDERSDIYSFGIVLYEMFTGRVPFQGDTPYATIMGHINEPLPEPRSIDPSIPIAVEMVLKKALEKDRAHRYATVNEMVTALENAIRGPQEMEDKDKVPIVINPFAPEPQTAKPLSKPRTPAPRPGGPPKKAKSVSGPAADRRWVLIVVGVLAICVVAMCVASSGPIRSGLLATFIPSNPTSTQFGPLIPTTPTRSFVIGAQTPEPSAGATSSRSATATSGAPSGDTPRGKIAYSVATSELPENHSIWIANVNGTDARMVIEIAMWPALSPDGKQIAFYRLRDSGIYTANSDGSNVRKVLGYSNTCCVQWSPDAKRLAYFQGDLRKFGGSIFIANADGTNPTEIAIGFNPAWSPDGNRLVYTSCQPNTTQCGIFVIELRTKSPTILTRDNGANPQWSPRGDKIVYQADDGKGHINVFMVNPDGTGLKQLTFGRGNDGQPTWSRDGNFIFWRSDQNGSGWGLYSMRADGSGARLIINNIPASSNWGRESLSTGP